MSLDTYSGIIEAVERWLDRDDLNNLVPDFITLAEKRINRALRSIDMESIATTPLIDGQLAYELPCDYVAARNIYVDSLEVNLNYLTPDVMSTIDKALPIGYYTIKDGHIYLNNGATGNLVVEYYKAYPALSTTNQSNWLTANAPDLLLYGSLLEAEAYMVEDERIPVWTQAFYKGIEDINDASIEGRHSGDAMAIRSVY
jgi:hypothetical protein